MKNWLDITSYGNDDNSDFNSSTSSNSSTIANDTDQDGPTSQLWDLRWFALLSAPLLFGTMILPLIIGPTIRYTCRVYVRVRVFWRRALFLLAAIEIVLTLVLIKPSLSLKFRKVVWAKIAIESAIVVFLIYRRLIAWQVEWRRGIWLYLTSLVWLLLSILTDSFRIIGIPREIGLFISLLYFIAGAVLTALLFREGWID